MALLRRRVAALRGHDAELEAGMAEVAARSVDERFWVDLPLSRRMLAAEIDHLTTLADRIAAGDLAWPDPPAAEPPGVP
ncbi:MAG: hypothetical protein ACTHJL_04195 [Amnibacterium sp.]